MGQTENGYNYIFDSQKNLGWGRTFNMTGKAPAINKRIFEKLEYAQAYVDNPLDTAIEGLILTVIGDSKALNGAYLVKSVAMPVYNEDGSIKYDNEGNAEIAGGKLGELVKLSDSNIDASLFKVVSELPTASANVLNKIYLKKDTTIGDSENKYTEYICVDTDNNGVKSYEWEKFGEYKATIELDNVLKTDSNNQIGGLSVSFTGDTLYAETGAGETFLELGTDHVFFSVDGSNLKVVNSGATIIGRDEVVISSGENGDTNINKIKINSSGTTLSRENADIIMEDDKIKIQGRDNVTIGYNSEGHYMSISSGETIIARNNNTISLTDGDLEIDVNGTIFGFDSSGASFPKDGLTVGGTTVSLEGHDHDDLYHSKNDVYTKTEVYTRAEVEQKIGEIVAGDISGQYIPTSAITTGTLSDDSSKENLVASASHNHDGNIVFTNAITPYEAKVEGEGEGVTNDPSMPSINITESFISFNLGEEKHAELSLNFNSEEEKGQLLFNDEEIATKKYTDDEIGKLNNIISGLRSLVIEVQGKNTQLQAQLNALEAKAITSITTDNKPEDMVITGRNDDGSVSITLKGISNIAFDEAAPINGENTAQF